jgi:hypothetical protein
LQRLKEIKYDDNKSCLFAQKDKAFKFPRQEVIDSKQMVAGLNFNGGHIMLLNPFFKSFIMTAT